MPPSKDLLVTAWNAYLVTQDAFKVSQRAALSGHGGLFSDLNVLEAAPDAAELALNSARKRSDEFVILAMWAEFERCVIEFLEKHTESLSSHTPDPLWQKLAPHISKEVEYWRSDDRLDVLKGLVDPQRVGAAKQVNEFRNWVAHKNPNRPPSAQVDPAFAYQLLTQILGDLDSA